MTAAPSGVVSVLKPPGMTSHDVVDYLRRITKLRKIGHTGTLDPLAAGVLVLVVGRATRAAGYFTALAKRYRAEAILGIRTSSGDADGEIISAVTANQVTPEAVAAAAQKLTGTVLQRPPTTSAVKINGERLYKLARRGEPVEAPVRQVQVYKFDMLSWVPGIRPRVRFDIHCSSGTYIRSLIDDLGEMLGVGAMVSFLLRTAVGPFTAGTAWTLEELEDRWRHDRKGILMPLSEALSFLQAVYIPREYVIDVAYGRRIKIPGLTAQLSEPDKPFRLLDPNRRLVAVGRLGDKAGPRDTVAYDLVLVRPEEVVHE